MGRNYLSSSSQLPSARTMAIFSAVVLIASSAFSRESFEICPVRASVREGDSAVCQLILPPADTVLSSWSLFLDRQEALESGALDSTSSVRTVKIHLPDQGIFHAMLVLTNESAKPVDSKSVVLEALAEPPSPWIAAALGPLSGALSAIIAFLGLTLLKARARNKEEFQRFRMELDLFVQRCLNAARRRERIEELPQWLNSPSSPGLYTQLYVEPWYSIIANLETIIGQYNSHLESSTDFEQQLERLQQQLRDLR